MPHQVVLIKVDWLLFDRSRVLNDEVLENRLGG